MLLQLARAVIVARKRQRLVELIAGNGRYTTCATSAMGRRAVEQRCVLCCLPHQIHGWDSLTTACTLFRNAYYCAVRVAAASPPSKHVLRLIDVELMSQKEGGTVGIALVFPCVDFALRTWCQAGCRAFDPQELRHIAWDMMLGITHLHSHGVVQGEINPDTVLLKGSGFRERAGRLSTLGEIEDVAHRYAANAYMLLNHTMLACIIGSETCSVQRSYLHSDNF